MIYAISKLELELSLVVIWERVRESVVFVFFLLRSINYPLSGGILHCSLTYLKCTLCFLHTQFAINLKQLCWHRAKEQIRSTNKKHKTTTTTKHTQKLSAVKWYVACQPHIFSWSVMQLWKRIFTDGLKLPATRVNHSFLPYFPMTFSFMPQFNSLADGIS